MKRIARILPMVAGALLPGAAFGVHAVAARELAATVVFPYPAHELVASMAKPIAAKELQFSSAVKPVAAKEASVALPGTAILPAEEAPVNIHPVSQNSSLVMAQKADGVSSQHKSGNSEDYDPVAY